MLWTIALLRRNSDAAHAPHHSPTAIEKQRLPQPNTGVESARELFMAGVPVSGMIGLAVVAGVMLLIGMVQCRR